jgi:3-oxoadipate enol-lactonase
MVPSGAAFFEQLAPVMESYQRGDSAAAIGMFLHGIGRPNAREIVERAVPGGFEQAVQDADTFFQVEVPALGAWTFTEADARRITQPVLSVLGEESLPIFSEVGELVRTWFPRVQELPVPGACHFLQMENARAVAEGLQTFFRANPAPAQLRA